MKKGQVSPTSRRDSGQDYKWGNWSRTTNKTRHVNENEQDEAKCKAKYKLSNKKWREVSKKRELKESNSLRKKEKDSWNYNRSLHSKRAIISYQCLRRNRKRNESDVRPTVKNRVLILKERNYLAADSQCTNRTGTIHLIFLSWINYYE